MQKEKCQGITTHIDTAVGCKNSNKYGQIAEARFLLNAEMFGDMTTSSWRELHILILWTPKKSAPSMVMAVKNKDLSRVTSEKSGWHKVKYIPHKIQVFV